MCGVAVDYGAFGVNEMCAEPHQFRVVNNTGQTLSVMWKRLPLRGGGGKEIGEWAELAPGKSISTGPNTTSMSLSGKSAKVEGKGEFSSDELLILFGLTLTVVPGLGNRGTENKKASTSSKNAEFPWAFGQEIDPVALIIQRIFLRCRAR